MKGIVHVHSTHSFDGKLSYDELKTFLSGKGLSFACITEHIEQLEQENIDRIVADCRAASDETFLFVPGIEMDCFKVFFLGVEPVTVDFTSNETIFQSLRPKARLCVFAHPIKARWNYPDWLIELCDGVEVWNAKHDGKHLPRAPSVRLLERVRARRPGAVALGGLDFHDRKDFFPLWLQLEGDGPLTEESVLERIGAGAFTLRKQGEDVARIRGVRRWGLRLRQKLMDAGHFVHRTITGIGLPVPKPLKRFARRLLEG